MKRAKYVFMKCIKIKTPKEKKAKETKNSNMISNADYIEETTNQSTDWFNDNLYVNEHSEMFDDSLYEDKETKGLIERLNKFEIAYDYKVSRKEALTSIEAKTPFLVEKLDSKKIKIEEKDNVYKTISKIKHSDGIRARRIGYIKASDKIEKQSIAFMKESNIVGILEDKCIITKKRGLNQRKIGYVKVQTNDTNMDSYIEVTKSKGIGSFLIWAIIISMILVLNKVGLPENWNFNLKNFRLYKTKEHTEYIENVVEISHNVKTVLTDNIIKLGMVSKHNSTDNNKMLYSVKIVDAQSEDIIYESDILEDKIDIAEIKISKEYEAGEYECKIICNTYADNELHFIGTVESKFTLIVK